MIALLTRYWPAIVGAIGAGIVLILLLILFSGAQDSARDAGAAGERAASATTALNRTEKAHAAAEAVRSEPAARDAECLRHARNPDDC